MGKILFGTDGIRGVYGKSLLGGTAYRLGNALGKRGGRIVVGRDTRLSGVELYKYLRKGILDAGAHLINLNIVPTPIVSYVTERIHADFGVVITASHNTSEYNGLKVFSSNGTKLQDDAEERVERDMMDDIYVNDVRGVEDSGEQYVSDYINGLIEAFSGISGLNVGLDTTNGALSHVAPKVADRIFNSVIAINDDGDARHINEESGALHPDAISRVVMQNKLDVGFAFDGDGDRIIAVSPSGRIINGDMMLYIISKYLKSEGKLSNNIAIGTIYTNMGIEKSLNRAGITLLRTDVGDSNVIAKMCEHHASVGGERAGHIILRDYAPTGDGLLVAIYLANIMCKTGKSLDELAVADEYYESSFDFVTDKARDIATDSEIIAYKNSIIKGATKDVRILMRASGTENKLRIMVESEDKETVSMLGSRLLIYIHERYKV